MEGKYTIKDLCERFNITPRTIYYYISIGLLPPAGKRGRGFNFSEEFAQQLQNVLQYRNKVRLSAIPQMQGKIQEFPSAKKVITIKMSATSTDFLEYAYDAIEAYTQSVALMSSGMLSRKENQAMIVVFPVTGYHINEITDKLSSLQLYAQSYNGGVALKAYTSVDALQHAIVENVNE